MQQVPVRALEQDTAGVLARVQNGESLEITSQGRVVARLIPARAAVLDDLVASGLIVAPTITGRLSVPAAGARSASDAGELLSSIREDERC
jgi:prevent-host-death family protein